MTESLIRSGISGELFEKGNLSDICDMDAINIYSTIVTGISHPTREIDGDRYEISITLSYQKLPLFIDAALPF